MPKVETSHHFRETVRLSNTQLSLVEVRLCSTQLMGSMRVEATRCLSVIARTSQKTCASALGLGRCLLGSIGSAGWASLCLEAMQCSHTSEHCVHFQWLPYTLHGMSREMLCKGVDQLAARRFAMPTTKASV